MSGKTPTKLGWGWSEIGVENAHGPFKTRNETLDAAKKHLALVNHPGEYEIEVGRCEPAIIDDHTPGPEDVLEWINQHAYDNGFSWVDEGVFEFKKGADDRFFVAFQELVRKYIVSTGTWQLVETEKVKVAT